jgi:hypothetical protein
LWYQPDGQEFGPAVTTSIRAELNTKREITLTAAKMAVSGKKLDVIIVIT